MTYYNPKTNFTIITNLGKNSSSVSNNTNKYSDIRSKNLISEFSQNPDEQKSNIKQRYLQSLSYTVSPLLHIAINKSSNKQQNIVRFGSNKLTIDYITSDDIGIYGRRFLSYLVTQSIKTKSFIINLPSSRGAFLSKVLNIKYHPSFTDTIRINKQIKALATLLLSIKYTNHNKTSRINFDCISFFDDDVSFLYSDNQKWQKEIKLSADAYHLFRSSAVPISQKSLMEFKSALHIDIFNYFSYQNYNLSLREIKSESFNIEDLYYQFGSEQTLRVFKSKLRYFIDKIKDISDLNIDVTKNKIILTTNEDCLLRKKVAKKNNQPKQFKPAQISPEIEEKLIQKYGEIEYLAAEHYLNTRIEQGVKKGNPVTRPLGYLKHTLNNPEHYANAKAKVISKIDDEQFNKFKSLSKTVKSSLKNELTRRVKNTSIDFIPKDLKQVYQQLRDPYKFITLIPNFDYCLYLYAIQSKLFTSRVPIVGLNVTKIFEMYAYLK